MTVLIKGMEMPENCYECKFCRPKQPYPCHCYAGGFPIKPSETDLRDGLCPLVPVPPHGRLIDADALPWENQGFMLTDPDEWGLKVWDIEHAPTIIEADKEGE